MPTAICGSALTGVALFVFWITLELLFPREPHYHWSQTNLDGNHIKHIVGNHVTWKKILAFGRSSWKLVAVFLVALSLRVQAFAFTVSFSQCTYPGIEVSRLQFNPKLDLKIFRVSFLWVLCFGTVLGTTYGNSITHLPAKSQWHLR